MGMANIGWLIHKYLKCELDNQSNLVPCAHPQSYLFWDILLRQYNVYFFEFIGINFPWQLLLSYIDWTKTVSSLHKSILSTKNILINVLDHLVLNSTWWGWEIHYGKHYLTLFPSLLFPQHHCKSFIFSIQSRHT